MSSYNGFCLVRINAYEHLALETVRAATAIDPYTGRLARETLTRGRHGLAIKIALAVLFSNPCIS